MIPALNCLIIRTREFSWSHWNCTHCNSCC